MAQETKNITLRLPIETVEYIESCGDEQGITQGVKNIVKKLQDFERHADLSIKNKFVPEEWKAMADALNGTLVEGQFRYSPEALIAQMEDAETYEKVCTKWDMDLTILCAKIQSLSPTQIEAIHRRIEKFWHTPDTDFDTWSKY